MVAEAGIVQVAVDRGVASRVSATAVTNSPKSCRETS